MPPSPSLLVVSDDEVPAGYQPFPISELCSCEWLGRTLVQTDASSARPSWPYRGQGRLCYTPYSASSVKYAASLLGMVFGSSVLRHGAVVRCVSDIISVPKVCLVFHVHNRREMDELVCVVGAQP